MFEGPWGALATTMLGTAEPRESTDRLESLTCDRMLRTRFVMSPVTTTTFSLIPRCVPDGKFCVCRRTAAWSLTQRWYWRGLAVFLLARKQGLLDDRVRTRPEQAPVLVGG